jgi:hypothetical protein
MGINFLLKTIEICAKSPLKKTNFEHSKTTSGENNRPMHKALSKMWQFFTFSETIKVGTYIREVSVIGTVSFNVGQKNARIDTGRLNSKALGSFLYIEKLTSKM